MAVPFYRVRAVTNNLGNCLYQQGRIVDAIEQWDAALSEHPIFAMALASRAGGLKYYSEILYTDQHRRIFLSEAFKSYSRVFSSKELWDSEYPEIKENILNEKKELYDYIKEINVKINYENVIHWWNNLNYSKKNIENGVYAIIFF